MIDKQKMQEIIRKERLAREVEICSNEIKSCQEYYQSGQAPINYSSRTMLIPDDIYNAVLDKLGVQVEENLRVSDYMNTRWSWIKTSQPNLIIIKQEELVDDQWTIRERFASVVSDNWLKEEKLISG